MYLRRVEASKKVFGSDMSMCIWMGTNPVGRDRSLGCASPCTLEEGMRYRAEVRSRVAGGSK